MEKIASSHVCPDKCGVIWFLVRTFGVPLQIEAERQRNVRLAVAASTLQRLYRCGRIGPRWYRAIGRRVKYEPADVEFEVWLTYI